MLSLRAQSVTSCAVGISSSPSAPTFCIASVITSSRLTVNPQDALSAIYPPFIPLRHSSRFLHGPCHCMPNHAPGLLWSDILHALRESIIALLAVSPAVVELVTGRRLIVPSTRTHR